jgi:hypothetical protein
LDEPLNDEVEDIAMVTLRSITDVRTVGAAAISHEGVNAGGLDVVADGRGGPAADLFEARLDLAVLQLHGGLPMPGGQRRRQSYRNMLGRQIIHSWGRVSG